MGDPVRRRADLFLSLILFSALSGLSRARAEEAAVCTVRVIQAHQAGGESGSAQHSAAPYFDPRLEPLRKQLTQPPFSAWHSFHLIQQHDLNLQKDTLTGFTLPGAHDGALTYLGQVESPKRHRVRVHLELRDGAAKLVNTVVLIDDGGTFLQGGIRNAGGVLVLGFTCHHRPSVP